MTADVNGNVIINDSTTETEDNQCGLDISGYEDLPTPAADCNGFKNGNESGKGNREDDPDASYVFVGGNDAVADEPADTADLNGNSEPIHNVGSCDVRVDNEAVELVLDHGNEDVEISAMEGDAGSPMKHGIASDHEKGENAAVEVPNGMNDTVGDEELNSNTVLEGTKEFQFDVSEAVDSEIKSLQVSVNDEKAKEEDNVESIVAKESQVTCSADVAESEPSQSGDVEVASCENIAVSELNQSLQAEVTSSSDITKSEPNHSGNTEVINSMDIAQSELNQSGNIEDTVEGESKLNLPSTVEKNQDSPVVIIDGTVSDNDLDLDQGMEQLTNNFPLKDPQEASKVELEQNLEATTCSVEANAKLERDEVVDASLFDEYGNKISAGHAGDSVAETGVVNGFMNSVSEEVVRNKTLTSSDSENGIIFPAASDDDATGDPKKDVTMPVEQLESETINGHIACQKEETLSTGHAEESDSQTINNDFSHAGQTKPEKDKPSEALKPVISDNPATDGALEAVLDIGNSYPVDDSEIYETRAETIDEKLDANSSDSAGPHFLSDREFMDPGSHCLVKDMIPSSSDTTAKPEPETDSIAIKFEEVSALSSDEVNIESEVPAEAAQYFGSNIVLVEDPDREACVHDSDQNPVAVKAESEVDSSSVVSKEVPQDEGHAPESEVPDGYVNSSERTLNCIQNDLHVENRGNQFVSIDGDEKTSQEIGAADGDNPGDASASTPEGCAVSTSDWQNVMAEKMPFYYMIKIPRNDGGSLKEQIKHAQNQVDEKTKSRDVIRVEMQKHRANCNECGACVDAAISDEIAARDLLKAKRKEIDSVQSVIDKIKSAQNVGEIDGKIRNMEHMLQHETLPLKEEKNYIRAIQQLKQTREKLSSNLGNQEDVQEAINQKEQLEERLKVLRKEADLLRENVLKAEGATKSAKKKYQDENAKLNEVKLQFRAADDVRQQAYADLQILRKQLYDKNEYFRKYKDDAKVAYDLASKGDKEELQCHCVKQVEKVMELWNSNDEFRKEYIRCNMRSTLRRLLTLDGRSLGPDEEPPVFPNVSERVTEDNAVPSISALEEEKTVEPVKTERKKDKSTAKFGDQINPTVKSEKPAKHAPSGNGLATVSGRNEIEEAGQQEENQLTREEKESIRKAEELRKEEEAAMLKEQRRLEEKAKAIEAMERKKRNADKAQARAALRAQKEAEQKQKEREKKARKKRTKAVEEELNEINGGESAPSTEIPPEIKVSETGEKPTTVTKKSQKPSHFLKQTKPKSIPLPLRNRGKRRKQTWMWALLAALVVLSLFLLGNGGFSLQRIGF